MGAEISNFKVLYGELIGNLIFAGIVLIVIMFILAITQGISISGLMRRYLR